ncbi:MAG: NAD-dependent epimerase/dehydratase family protein [Verrucomicrobiota bacterium]
MSDPESILITGGAGFVGSHLSLSAKKRFPNARVVAMDNLYRKGSELNVDRLGDAGCEFVAGDIRNRDDFPKGDFELLLECSAEPSVLAGYEGSPDYLMQTNLMGTYECLEKCRQWGSKVIFFSTSRTYPIAPMEQHPWQEEPTRFVWMDQENGLISSSGVKEELVHSPGAKSLYGFTKYSSELLIEEYRRAFGLESVINRCSVIAGPWQMGKVDQGVVGLWVLRHYFKQSLSYIGYGGSGKQVRDVMHVADLCDLVCRQIAEFDQWEGWCGNVGGGLPVSLSLMELTEACEEVTGNSIEISSTPETRQADLRIFLADCTRIKGQYGWKPSRGVQDVVVDVFEWIRDHEKLIKASGVA